MTSVEIMSAGNALGVELPEAILKRLGVEVEDTLNVREIPLRNRTHAL